ncbi:hypothetical protein pb186bvf_018609 [Paramecium bursaria]
MDELRNLIKEKQSMTAKIEENFGQNEENQIQEKPVQRKISELTLERCPNIFIIARVTNKQSSAILNLATQNQYFIEIKDSSKTIQLVGQKKRLKELYPQFFLKLQLQATYSIQNFNYQIYQGKPEIHLERGTIIKLEEQPSILYQAEDIIKYNRTQEFFDIIGTVIQARRHDPFSELELGVAKRNTDDMGLITILLFDEYKEIKFKTEEIILIEGLLVQKTEDAFRFKSQQQKTSITKDPSQIYPAEYAKLNELKKMWFIDIKMEEELPLLMFSKAQFDSLYSTIVKVTNCENEQTLDTISFQMKKVILVTQDNLIEKKLIIVGADLLQFPFQLNQILFLTHVKYDSQCVKTTDRTLILDFSEHKNPSKQMIELAKDLQKEFKKPSKFKLKIQNAPEINEQIKQRMNQEKQPETLAWGKQNRQALFNAIVTFLKVNDELQVKNNRMKNCEIIDETGDGKITFWNQQIKDFRKGQTIYIQNIYFDSDKNEYKTSARTQIEEDVPQRPMPKINFIPLFNQYDIDFVNIRDSKEGQINYCRAIILEFICGKIQIDCKLCPGSTIQKTHDSIYCYKTDGTNHKLYNPKPTCFVRIKLSNQRKMEEVILVDEEVEKAIGSDIMNPQKICLTIYCIRTSQQNIQSKPTRRSKRLSAIKYSQQILELKLIGF